LYYIGKQNTAVSCAIYPIICYSILSAVAEYLGRSSSPPAGGANSYELLRPRLTRPWSFIGGFKLFIPLEN